MSATNQITSLKTLVPLLPFFYKKVGFVLFAVSMLTAITLRSAGNETFADSDNSIRQLVIGLLVISFVCMVFSKEKIENAHISTKRKRALLSTLICLPLSVALDYFVIQENKTLNHFIWTVIRSSAMWYLLSFYLFNYSWTSNSKKK